MEDYAGGPMKTAYRASLCSILVGFLPIAAAPQDKASMSWRSTSNPSSLSKADRLFVKDAADGGMAEVELGRLAVERASNAEVKKFGQRMVEDHSKANEELKDIAGKKNIALPNELAAKHKATRDRLSKLSGAEFDKAYMSDMLKDHNKDVAAFQRESTAGRDPDLKSFAAQTLPTLKDHLKEARSIAAKVMQSRQENK
jgi:putative membrane protein